MMNDHAVEQRIGRIFEQKLNLAVPSPATDLFASGGLDSLSFVELLLQLEQEYGIRIPLQDLDLADFRSIERIASFIRQKLGAVNRQPETQYNLVGAQCPA